jgi:hypothetical protein
VDQDRIALADIENHHFSGLQTTPGVDDHEDEARRRNQCD